MASPMLEIPELTPAERAMLHRFRVDESPEPAIAARVLRGISAQLDDGPAPIERPWWLWLRAGGISVAIAASALLLLGGTARVVSRVGTPAPTEAIDAAKQPALQQSQPAAPELPTAPREPPVASPPPAVESAVPETLEPVAPTTDATRSRAARPSTRPTNAPVASAGPVDAAAEIALFRAIKVERDAKTRLASIQRYRRDFAKGSFVQEVAVLEIEALCELGRTGEADERSTAFARAFGDSAYSAIARRGCAAAKP